MTPIELSSAAVGALLAGKNITLHLPVGEKWPPWWPRGELLSVNDLGKNVSFDPLKVLASLQRLAKIAALPTNDTRGNHE